jgi:hypothetical protein
MLQIKHIILFLFTLTYLSAQVADTTAVSVSPQDDVAAPLVLAAPQSPDAISTVAVLDFEPRGINALEAQTLTDLFATEIKNTGRAVLVDRSQMTKVMQEQGYEQAGCTSEECAAEVGALLGVEFMINGAIEKLGDTYTIDVKIFNVQTGTAERTKSVTYTGPVDGMITEIEILAWLMMGLEPPDYLMEKQDKSGAWKNGGKENSSIPLNLNIIRMARLKKNHLMKMV